MGRVAVTGQSRQPAGAPTGGQFASSGRDEADVELPDGAPEGRDDPYEPPRHADRPAAYAYRAEHWTPAGIVEQLIREGRAAPAARDMAVEDMLDQIAGAEALDDLDRGKTELFPQVVRAGELAHGDTLLNEHGAHVTVDLGLGDDDRHDDSEPDPDAGQTQAGPARQALSEALGDFWNAGHEVTVALERALPHLVREHHPGATRAVCTVDTAIGDGDIEITEVRGPDGPIARGDDVAPDVRYLEGLRTWLYITDNTHRGSRVIFTFDGDQTDVTFGE